MKFIIAEMDAIVASYGQAALSDDYTEVFSSAGNLSDENLLEIQYSSYTNPQTSDDNYFAFQGPAHAVVSVKKFNGGNLGGGWGFLPPSEKLRDFMLERGEGVRYAVSILSVGEETFAGDTLLAELCLENDKRFYPYPLVALDAYKILLEPAE